MPRNHFLILGFFNLLPVFRKCDNIYLVIIKAIIIVYKNKSGMTKRGGQKLLFFQFYYQSRKQFAFFLDLITIETLIITKKKIKEV